MATQKIVIGARTSLNCTGGNALATLTNASFSTSDAVNNTTNQPIDLIVELAVTPGTVAGNKQALLYAIGSLDGTNYGTGVTTADVNDMTLIGVLPLATNSTLQRKLFEVAACFGGVLPPYLKFVAQNDSGVTWTTGTLYTSEVSGTVT